MVLRDGVRRDGDGRGHRGRNGLVKKKISGCRWANYSKERENMIGGGNFFGGDGAGDEDM